VNPRRKQPLKFAWVELGDTPRLQRYEPFGHDVVDKGIGLGGVKVEGAVDDGGGHARTNEDNQGPGDLILDEVPLPEDRQDVFEPGTRRLAEDVLAPDSIEVTSDVGRSVTVGKERLRIGQECSCLDDLSGVRGARIAAFGQNNLGTRAIHVRPLAPSRVGSERDLFCPRLTDEFSRIDRSSIVTVYLIQE
jgi:hypothetical protein